MPNRDRWGPEGPPPEAYSRVTNPERFQPLHAAMLEIIDWLERDFDVERTEGYGLDKELERNFELAGPRVRLTPRDPDAAPIAVVFTAFPGLHLRFGRWYTEPFPICGCDACDESADYEVERLTEMIDDVTTGRFRESVHRPLIPFVGSAWYETEFWSPGGHSWSKGRIAVQRAREMSDGRRRLDLNWKPWPRR